MNASKEERIKTLKKLVYDFFNSREAIDIAKKYDNITDWCKGIMQGLKPSIKGFEKEKINLLLSYIIYEHADRNFDNYENQLNAFVEMYKNNKGEIF